MAKKRKKRKTKKKKFIWLPVLLLVLGTCAWLYYEEVLPTLPKQEETAEEGLTLEEVPIYSGEPFVVLKNGEPAFSEEEKASAAAFERYSPLDLLGRCGVAFANVGPELMPTEERGSIGMVKPSGWQLTKYDSVDGKYLYNRCHLIAYQLTGENDNEKNLITGTRYLNVEGMLPFENQVAEYIRKTGNHVLYRVTPIFQGADLVAGGVQMEAWSVEDEGAGVRFHVYVYNVQPGIVIDYANGESRLEENGDSATDGPLMGQVGEAVAGEPEPDPEAETPQQETPEEPAVSEGTEEADYILNIRSMRFHLPDCSGGREISEKNRQTYEGDREELLEQGYVPCGQCKP